MLFKYQKVYMVSVFFRMVEHYHMHEGHLSGDLSDKFIYFFIYFSWNNGVPCSKPMGGSKVDSAFHPPEVDKMSTRNFWELSS